MKYEIILITPELNDKGIIEYVQIISHDITKLKNSQKKLDILEDAINNLKEAVYIIDMSNNHKILYVNDTASAMLGYTNEELLNMCVADIDAQIPSDEIGKHSNFDNLVFETAHRTKTGNIIEVFISASLFTHDNFSFRIAIVQDISEQKKLIKKLSTQEWEYRSLVENFPANIARWDSQGRLLYINKTLEKTLGISPETILGKTNKEVFPNGRYKQIDKALEEVIRTEKKVLNTQQKVIFEDGTEEIHAVNLVPEFDEEGNLHSILGFGSNITEIVNLQNKVLKHEQAIHEQKEMFKSLAEHTKDTIIRYDLNCRRTYLNPRALDLFGRKKEDILGKTPSEFSPILANKDFEGKMRIAIATGKIVEVESTFIQPDGQIGWGSQHIIPEKDEDGEVVNLLVIGRDLTDWKHKERFLMEKEQLFRNLVESNPDAIVRYDEKGKRIYANPAFFKITGINQDQFKGKKAFSDINSHQANEYQEKLNNAIKHDQKDEMVLEWMDINGKSSSNLIRFVPEKDLYGNTIGAIAIGRITYID